jgi:hypothetical protein
MIEESEMSTPLIAKSATGHDPEVVESTSYAHKLSTKDPS